MTVRPVRMPRALVVVVVVVRMAGRMIVVVVRMAVHLWVVVVVVMGIRRGHADASSC